MNTARARWARIEQIFAAALEAGADSQSVLERECAGDPELTHEVKSLLVAHAVEGEADRLERELAQQPAAAGPAPGDQLGRYTIAEQLGSGGMGLVYAARDERLDRTVALKLLPRVLSVDHDATRRFLLEARSAASLDHPNICVIHEITEADDGRLFIAMPLYQGETVEARLDRGPMPVAVAVAVAAGVARGLEHAHARGIVHRDIKPGNLFILDDGTVKILDFGIAKVTDVNLTSSGAIVGTMPYMSPEQAGGTAVDHRTDLWSLGVVLYEMIAGRRPFQGASAEATFASILTADPPPLRSVPGAGAVTRILCRLLAKDRAERPADAGSAATALEAVLDALQHGPVWAGAEDAPPIAPEGERRQVAVLVTHVRGYAELVERVATDELDDVIERIRTNAMRIVVRHGGVVHRFSGESLVCLFGVPATHEDDVAGAVRAARALHAWSAGQWLDDPAVEPPSLDLCSGICAGTVVVQPDPGSRSHRVAGSPLDRASRLASHGEPDEILVGPECHRPLAAFFRTRPGVPLVASEEAGAAMPYIVVDEIRAPAAATAEWSVSTPFAGREHELAVLREGLALAQAGEGQFVTVEGEAGAGKSRLLHEFGRDVSDSDMRFVRVWCRTDRLGPAPYLPFVAALRELLEIPTAPAHALDTDIVADGIAEMAPEMAESVPLFLHLIGAPAERHPLPRHLEGERLRSAIRDALVAFVTLTTRRAPVVLVLEDWHWADEASRDVLVQLAELLPAYPLAVVVSYRPGHGIEWPESTPRRSVQLGPLDTAATALLAQAVLGTDSVPPALAATIQERAGGNPFFVEELCHALREQREVIVNDGQPELAAPLDTLHLPVTIQGIIRTRLDRLDPAARDVARAASVAGRDFTLSLLQELAGPDVPLSHAIDRLKQAAIIQQTRVVPEPAYRFRHILMQEVVYDTLLAHRRRALHAQVGTALERLHADRRDELADVLSYHFSRAEAWREAVRYGRESARQAHGLSEFPRALQVIDQVEGWARRLRRETELREALTDILLQQERLCETLGFRTRQQEILGRLLELLQSSGDRTLLAEVYRRQADLHVLLKDFAPAQTALDRALALCREAGSEEAERAALNSLGLLCWHAGRPRDGLPFLEQALAIDRARGASDEICRDLFNLFTLHRADGDWDRASAALEEARELTERTGDSTVRCYVLYSLALQHRMRGDIERAFMYMRETLELSREHGLSLQTPHVLTSLASIQLERGDVEPALASYREAVDMGRRMRHVDGLSQLLCILGDVLAGLGRGGEALPHFREAAGLFAQLENRDGERRAWHRIGTLEHQFGDRIAAADAWDRVRELSREADDDAAALEATIHMARALRDVTDEAERARAAFRDGLGLAEQLEDRERQGELHNAAGILEWRVREYDAALAHYQTAARIYHELGDQPREGLALNSIGATLLCLGRPDAARLSLEKAVSLNHDSGQAILEGHALSCLGDACLAEGDVGEAARCYGDSLAIRRRIGDRRGEGWVLHQLARTAEARGEQINANGLRRDARHIAVETGDVELLEACDARPGMSV